MIDSGRCKRSLLDSIKKVKEMEQHFTSHPSDPCALRYFWSPRVGAAFSLCLYRRRRILWPKRKLKKCRSFVDQRWGRGSQAGRKEGKNSLQKCQTLHWSKEINCHPRRERETNYLDLHKYPFKHKSWWSFATWQNCAVFLNIYFRIFIKFLFLTLNHVVDFIRKEKTQQVPY